MTLLGILLIVLALIKLAVDTKVDWDSIEENLKNDPDVTVLNTHRAVTLIRGAFVLDSLLGIICGLFIIFI